jgi:hypothetical protein
MSCWSWISRACRREGDREITHFEHTHTHTRNLTSDCILAGSVFVSCGCEQNKAQTLTANMETRGALLRRLARRLDLANAAYTLDMIKAHALALDPNSDDKSAC